MEDLISILPNEILLHIISMLPFKEAVRSSALSAAWSRLITPLRVNLQPGGSAQPASRRHELNSQIIESLSMNSGAGFQRLKLHLDSSDVAFAVCTNGVNGELHLDFSQPHHHHHQLNIYRLIVEQTSSLRRRSFSLIRILHLRSVSHLAGEMVTDLCSSCSFLERLKLEKCRGLKNFELRSSDSLKEFEMSNCCDIARIAMSSARNLDSFSYKGVFTVIELLDVPNLVDVTLDFGHGLGKDNAFDCEDVISLLSSVKDIRTLKLSTWLIQALCCAGVIFGKLDFQFSRLKDLKLICSRISSKSRDSLACFLHMTPSLEELELNMNQHRDEDSNIEEFAFNCQNWHEPHLWKDYATVKNEACRLKYMKRIKIMGFTLEKDDILLMDVLLHSAINLKEMIVDDIWRVARVPYTQLHYIKPTYLLIPCSDIDSYFVLIYK